MPPKMEDGEKSCHHSKAFTSTTSAASVSNPSATPPPCKLPEDVIVSIIKRLPVKSIHRFKCVSKRWLSLLATRKFISMHHEEFSKNPLNHSFIIRSTDKNNFNMSLLNVNSTERQPVSLVNPFPVSLGEMDFVGCVNGLVCLCWPPLGEVILLWNPALNLCKALTTSKRDLCETGEEINEISVGFAYDSTDDDYNVIRIASLRPKRGSPEALLRSRAEVYSARLDSWKRVQIDSSFSVSGTRSKVIAKGVPYWTAMTYQGNSQSKCDEVLVYYDMRKESFKHVTLPKLAGHDGIRKQFVEWKGNLAISVSSPRKDREDFVDIQVYDKMGMCWNQVSRHGPIGMKMGRPLQCSKDGVILAETEKGKLILYDPVTNGIKTFCIPEARKRSFEASSYTESLVTFKGMEQVKEQDKNKYLFAAEASKLLMLMMEMHRFYADDEEEEEEDDDDDDDDDDYDDDDDDDDGNA